MRAFRGDRVFDVVNMVVLGSVALLAVYPFLYTLTMSLSTPAAASRPSLHLFPTSISLTSYGAVFANPEVITGYLNTIARALMGTACTLTVTCLAAYALARRDLPGRRFFLVAILFTFIFNGGLVPQFLVVTGLGLYDTRLAYILPALTSAFYILIVRNFFEQIPGELREAATIDGAGEWRILWHVYLPISKPVLATLLLWVSVWHWNQWLDALLYIESASKLVMQAMLQRIVINNQTEMLEKGLIDPSMAEYTPETLKAATVVITLLPILVLYPFVQRFFVKGIMIGGVKE